jgi:transcriptional regulator with XRE-family HTH domain
MSRSSGKSVARKDQPASGRPAKATLGELLRQVRDRHELSMEEVASRLGVRHSAYRLWERDAVRPNADHLGAVALWLEIPVPTLLRHLDVISEEEEHALLRLAAEALSEKAEEGP